MSARDSFLDVADFNTRIRKLSYSAVSQRDYMALRHTFGDDLDRWLASALARPEARGAEFHALRSALFGVSSPCHAALLSRGLDVGLVALLQWLVARGETGRQMIRKLGRPIQGREIDAVLNEVRSALISQSTVQQSSSTIKERTMKVNGSNYGLTVEQTWNVHGQATLQLEMAVRLGNGRCDWANKLAVQLQDHEVVGVLSVLVGRATAFEGTNHGPHHDKAFRVEAQSNVIYVNVRRGKSSYGVQVQRYITFRFIALALKAVMANNPGLTSDEILSITQIVGATHDRP